MPEDLDPAFDPAQTAPQPQEEAHSASQNAQTVTLSVDAPFYVSTVHLSTSDGATLSVDRRGTKVPADDADRYIEQAAAHGVTLTRK